MHSGRVIVVLERDTCNKSGFVNSKIHGQTKMTKAKNEGWKGLQLCYSNNSSTLTWQMKSLWQRKSQRPPISSYNSCQSEKLLFTEIALFCKRNWTLFLSYSINDLKSASTNLNYLQDILICWLTGVDLNRPQIWHVTRHLIHPILAVHVCR